jgi:DNA-binding protein YbaB
MLYLVGVNLSILGSIFCDSDDSGDEAVESSKNNEKSPKGKDVVRVTENTQKDTYTLEIKKKIVDSAIEKGPELVAGAIKDAEPKIGIVLVISKAAAEAIKHTGGMAPIPRLLTIGSAALVTAAGTSLGMELGKAAAENIQKGDEIEASKSKLA